LLVSFALGLKETEFKEIETLCLSFFSIKGFLRFTFFLGFCFVYLIKNDDKALRIQERRQNGVKTKKI
jgi:hypothetical protein